MLNQEHNRDHHLVQKSFLIPDLYAWIFSQLKYFTCLPYLVTISERNIDLDLYQVFVD